MEYYTAKTTYMPDKNCKIVVATAKYAIGSFKSNKFIVFSFIISPNSLIN